MGKENKDTAERDFFISFNSSDEAHAKAISDALRAEGFTTFFHPDDVEYGGYIPKWMDDALRLSRQMLALCSPKYMSEGALFSEAERYARFWQDTRGSEFKLIPVVLQKVEFPPLLAPYKRLIVTDKTPRETAAAVVAALKKPEGANERKSLAGPLAMVRHPTDVHTTHLPETPYEHLVGREAELKRLDEAWVGAKVNILSLIAEGGAGKSALVNEWLKRLQVNDYPGAEMVLGWSFDSQGTTERATSAEEFLNWALARLGVTLTTTSTNAKAEAIAEAMMRRRVLVVLDGVEPLQHGPGPQVGLLKDVGLRPLLRRFAATPPGATHGLIVLSSRIAVADISRFRETAAPVVDVEELSEEAGAALLRDNGVRGTDRELAAASRDFGGHPLALGLLASFLKETQNGDVRRRDHIRAFLADSENPRHDHARRVMESYEEEWLADRPSEQAIMFMVGLFDRPASGDCLGALRAAPAIEGLTDIIGLDDDTWQRAIVRLREVRLLAPRDPAAPAALDAHPLVREWFGERLRQTNEAAWIAAHGRLYEHLRDTTKEGKTPELEDLAPLYQAIAHGCRAGRDEEALHKVHLDRICRRRWDGGLEFYARERLGAFSRELAAISWFFEKPYTTPLATLTLADRSWVLGEAASLLRAHGRFAEALPAARTALRMDEDANEWTSAAIGYANLSEAEMHVGEVAAAISDARMSVDLADRGGDVAHVIDHRTVYAAALHAAGRLEEAEREFALAEQRLQEHQRYFNVLSSSAGYRYCDLLLARGGWSVARDRANRILGWFLPGEATLISNALENLVLGRAQFGLALAAVGVRWRAKAAARADASAARAGLGQAADGLRAFGDIASVARGLLPRAAFCRSVGDWDGAARDLDEVEEIAEQGPMKLFLCDMALERARLAFAKIEAFAPLNGLIDDGPSKPEPPSEAERPTLHDKAAKQLKIAADYIATCGYHRRDEELRELQAVLNGERAFASLPPRV